MKSSGGYEATRGKEYFPMALIQGKAAGRGSGWQRVPSVPYSNTVWLLLMQVIQECS